MIALIQRVARADVVVDGETLGAIGEGLLALWGVEKGDSETEARRLVDKVLAYRVFADAEDRMNLSLLDRGLELLMVPQFTLAADTRKGNRPSFSSAAPPDDGRRLFDYSLGYARERIPVVRTGRFGADMKVSLLNDGPVTFRLRIPPA